MPVDAPLLLYACRERADLSRQAMPWVTNQLELHKLSRSL